MSRIPVVQSSLGLTEAALGTALLGLSVGVVLALPLAGGFVARLGARTVTGVSAALTAAALPVVALAGDRVALFAALLLFGAGMSSMDVAMNALGVAVETRLERPVMVSFHAAWSLGGLVGTAAGAGAIRLDVGTVAHLTAAGVITAAIALAGWIMTRAADTARRTEPGPVLALPKGPLWLLGLVAASSALGEGAVADWSGVFLRDVAGSTEAVAAAGFVVFSLTMAAMRLVGDRLAGRFGPATVVRGGGAVAGLGFVIALALPGVAVSLLGFGLVGVGLAAVVPLTFAAAGRSRVATEGEAVASVAAVAYSAFLAGPPLIGFVAEATSLRLALGIIGVLVASIVFTGRVLPGRLPPQPAAATAASAAVDR